MAAANQVEIRITASGAEQAQRVLAGIAKEGAQLGTITAAGVKKADEAVGTFGISIQKVSGFMSQAGINTGIFGQAIGALVSPVGLAAASFAGLGVAVHTASESMVRNFEEVRRIQAVSGLSADAADNLADTFQLLGFKSEVLTTAMIKMAQELEGGGKGFAKLGVSIEDLQGKVEGDTFLMLRDRISELGTASERSAAGVAFFGRGFRELAPLFAMSTAEFEKFQARAAKFSAWSEEAAELTHRFVTSGNTLTLMFDGIAQEIGTAVLPGLIAFNEALADWVEAGRDALRVPIAAAWAVVASVATGLWDALKPIAEILWQLAKIILPPLAAILGGVFVAALVAVQAALIPITGAFVFLSEILKGNFTGAITVAGEAMAKQLTNIDETLAKSKVLGETLAALARGEVAAVEETDAAREKSSQKNAQLDQLKLQRAAASLGITQANALAVMALEEAMAKQRVALFEAPETDLIAVQQRALDAKEAALQKSYALDVAMAKQNNDLTGKAVADVEAKYIASYNQIAVARVGLSTKLLQITQAEEQALAGGGIALLQARLASADALLAIQQKSAADIAALHASDEAAFRVRLNNETQAAIVAAEAQTKTQADYAAAVEAIMQAHYAKLAQFREQASANAVAAMIANSAADLKDAMDLPEARQLTTDLIAMNRELMALQATTDLDAESIRRFGVSFALLDEKQQAALLSLRAWNAESAQLKSAEALLAIDRQAKLLGSSYDALSAKQAEFQRRILELQALKNPTGDVLAEIDQLKAKFADTKDLIFWRDAVKDVFGSISSAISTSVQGVILGTTTMAKAWENLWKSIVLSFINSGIQRLLKGVQDWLLGLFTGGSSGGFGEGIFGAIISGAGALVAKLSGGGTSLGNPVGSSASALDQVTTAAKGTASALNVANSGVSNFSAGIGAALSGLGVAAGIYGLTKGGSPASMAFSAGGTALSLYSLSVSASQLAVNAGLIGTALPSIGVLLAQGLASVAPTIAAAVGTAVYSAFGSSAVATALLGGGTAAAGGAAAGAGAGAAIAGSAGASFLGFVAFMVAGGFAGIAADAEDAAASFKEQMDAVQEALNKAGAAGLLFANLGKNLQESKLAASLEQLHGALRALGDLDLAVGLNQVIGDATSQGIMAQIPKLRATVGAAWLAAMDAATAKGIPIPSGSPGRDLTAPWAGAVGMQSFDDMLAQSAGAGRDGFDKLSNLLEHISQSLDTSLFQVNATGVRMVDLGAVNALLDKEFLTTSLRNAVVDIGALFGINAGQLGGIGAGEGNWRGTPGAGNMPSIAAIASAQAALEAAGFEPGKYGEALEKYLTSIDANLVNNPAWKKFVDMLHRAGGTAGGLVAAISAAIGQAMTPTQFYGVAKAATDGLTAALKEQMTARASETDTDALKAIDDSIAAMTETVKAWSSLVTLYTGLPVEMAAISGDLVKQTETSIEAWRVQMQSFTDAIVDSRKALDEAIAGGNIASIASAAQAVHDQTIGQYNAVLKAVESIHTAIQGILEQAGVLVDMMTSVAQLDIRSNGSFATIGSLLGSLQDIAEHGGTAAIRLFAVNKAIEAIIASLPTALEKFGSEGGAGAITGAVTGAARPFLAAQQGAIDQAQGAAQLALLQQQAQTINALASAVVAGIQQALSAALKAVRETADATIAGLTLERDAKLTAIDEEIGGIETEAARRHELHAQEIEGIQGVAKLYHDKAMAEIAAIETTAKAAHESRMAEIDGIQAAEDAAREYRAAEMDALSELINKAQEIESAVEGMGKFIDALKKGPLGPGNPADKLSLAQQSFAQALTAFNRNPTAGGLTDLQDLAQTMLSQAEPILSKPSPAFQALSANTIKQLIAAQALARAQMTDSQVLKAQLEHLQAIDKSTSASVREQIKAIQDADDAAGRKADAMIEAIQKRDEKEQAQAAALIKGIEDLDKAEQDQAKSLIDKLNENKAQITLDFEKQTTAIETAFKAQVDAINKAAADEIDHVQKGTAAALQANMAAQIPLLEAQYNAANAQLAAIGDTKTWQAATLAKLEELRVLLAGATGAESGMTRVTEGLYHLHDDEMVLPKGVANRIRSAAMGAGLPDETGRAVGEIIANWDNYSATEQQNIIAAYNAADDATRQSADQAASYWQASAAQTARAATRPPDLSNTGPWAPGSGDPLRDPWMAHVAYRKDGSAIYEPGYGPGASPGSVVKLSTGPATGPPPPSAPPPPPYIPPGPPWLYRGAGSQTNLGGASPTYGGGGSAEVGGGGPITVIVKLDGKTIGEATLPTVQSDARSGKMRTIILETRPK